MNKYFSEIDWSKRLQQCSTTDEAWNLVSTEIKKARDNHIPSVFVKQSNTKKPDVINNSILHLIREKRWFYKKYRKYPNQSNYALYCIARTKVNYYLRRERRLKETKIAKNMKGNSKEFYQYIKSKTTKKDPIPDLIDKEGNKISTGEEKSTLLNNFFSSVYTKENKEKIPKFESRVEKSEEIKSAEITLEEMTILLQKLKPDKSPGTDEIHPRLLKECAVNLAKPFKMLFDLTMKLAKIPQEWKQAEVRPIYKKKGKKSDPNNYRPVSLTSVVCKVIEKIIKKKLCLHLTSNNLLSPHQFGFVPGRSSNSQLLVTLKDWQKSLDNGTPIDIAYMDFKKKPLTQCLMNDSSTNSANMEFPATYYYG